MSDVVRQPMFGEGPLARFAGAGVAIAAIVGVYLGWREFWFLTDDAFIAFRYVSNSILGHGWVWNPPPFQPVEGYTSFLWVLLLDGVWRVTGVLPPDSANWLALAFGYATLWVGYCFARRMGLPPALERIRGPLWALVLLGTVSNRTFLAWLSSGLETSLFMFSLSCWIYFGMQGQAGLARSARAGVDAPGKKRLEGRPAERAAWQESAGQESMWMLGLTASAAAVALTRPDGLLFFVATLVLVLMRAQEPGRGWLRFVSAAPLLAVPIHLLWRFSTYGMWLPNTYYAKVTASWPGAGLRYLASFALEYGLWVWLVLACGALWAGARRRMARRTSERTAEQVERPVGVESLRALAPGWIVGGAVAAHVAYYTFIVGGDHFEYRIFSYLILWLFLSGAWFATRLGAGAPASLALMVVFLLASWPIPWMHWSKTRGLESRSETRMLIAPIAAEFPFPPGFRTLVAQWDEWQAWLIRRSVGSRHQEHKIAYLAGAMFWPPREEGARIGWEERAVLAIGGVGAAGWALPHVAIIDEFGLNDRVIAQNPTKRRAGHEVRVMAHERRPPKGYVSCFLPNVVQPYLASRRCTQELLERPVNPESMWGGALRAPVEVRRLAMPIDDSDFGNCDRLIVVQRPGELADRRIRMCETKAWP